LTTWGGGDNGKRRGVNNCVLLCGPPCGLPKEADERAFRNVKERVYTQSYGRKEFL
jgi:hypothetical protein